MNAEAANAAGAAIEIRQVVKRFQRTDRRDESFLAVDRLSFEVASAEMAAVLGRTGCGKSTMFNLLTGLIEPTEGKGGDRDAIRQRVLLALNPGAGGAADEAEETNA